MSKQLTSGVRNPNTSEFDRARREVDQTDDRILDEIDKGEGQPIPFGIGQPHDSLHDMTSEVQLPDE